MPSRYLRSEITSSRRWNRCSWKAQSLYIRLLTLVCLLGLILLLMMGIVGWSGAAAITAALAALGGHWACLAVSEFSC